MSVRKCIQWPDKRLRRKAADVSEITDDVRAVWTDLIDTMEALPGVGMGACQSGVMLRLAVVDASKERGKVIRMANPEILHASTELREHDEASPNLPGVSAMIKRPRAVMVKFLNDKGIVDRRDFVSFNYKQQRKFIYPFTTIIHFKSFIRNNGQSENTWFIYFKQREYCFRNHCF
jgi:peptide deformylase